MELHKYQYGSDPANVVELTENQARASNEALFYPTVDPSSGHISMYGRLELPDGITVEDYNSAADILNEYIKNNGGTVACYEGYLDNNPLLTRI